MVEGVKMSDGRKIEIKNGLYFAMFLMEIINIIDKNYFA